MEQSKEYYAFISYKREDEKWAKWLQDKLEHYRFPTNLNGRTDLPKHIRPTFRDVTDLKPGLLAKEIYYALQNSEWLIVVCSPRSAKSPWVCKEAQTFIDLGRADHIIPFVIEGNPFSNDNVTECYPEALLNLTGSKELLAANINEMGRDAAAIKVVACMFGLRFDTLWQRYEREKKKKRNVLLFLVFILLCATCAIFSYVSHQKNIANMALHEKNLQTLYNGYFRCERLYNEQKYTTCFSESKKILKSAEIVPDTLASRFEYLLRMSYASIHSDTLSVINRFKAEFPAMDWGSMPVTFSDDGKIVCVGCSGFTVIDVQTGKRLFSTDFWPNEIRVGKDIIYIADDYEIIIYNRATYKEIKRYNIYETFKEQHILGSCANGNRILAYSQNHFYIYDSQSLQLIQSIKATGTNASLNYNGGILALDEDNRLKLYNVKTGKLLDEYKNNYIELTRFDQSGKWLVLYLKDYNILRILNIETNESYHIEEADGCWDEALYNSFRFDGGDPLYGIPGDKYIVSDDGRYFAIAGKIYDMTEGTLYKTLVESNDAMGLLFLNSIGKVIQVNVNREIIIYNRTSRPLFEKSTLDFMKLRDDDTRKNEQKYDIKKDTDGKIVLKKKNGELMGVLTGIDGELYQVSISKDEKYALVSSLAIPLSIFDLSTGIVIQDFPFQPGNDGDLDFGVFGNDGGIYINRPFCTLKFSIIPLNKLLEMDLSEKDI